MLGLGAGLYILFLRLVWPAILIGFPNPTFPNTLASFCVQAVLFRAFRELETNSMRTSCSKRVFVTPKHARRRCSSWWVCYPLDHLLLLIVCSDPRNQHNRKSTASLTAGRCVEGSHPSCNALTYPDFRSSVLLEYLPYLQRSFWNESWVNACRIFQLTSVLFFGDQVYIFLNAWI